MIIKTTYIGTLNGVHGMWCGFLPEGAVIEEERLVLYPEPGYDLKNKISEEIVSAVWLKSAEQQQDWEEVEHIEQDEAILAEIEEEAQESQQKIKELNEPEL